MIKAVLFDVDGVLLDSFEANLKFYQDLMIASGYRPPTREEFPALFFMPMWDGIKAITKLQDENEIKKIWEMGRTKQVPYSLELLKTPVGAEKIIKTLANNYLLGIVTSRVQESIYSIPSLALLREYFKVAIGYQDTVKHKPDPEPLLFAVVRLGVLPAETVYIGDVETDIQAGHAAGMRVVIYSKQVLSSADACTASFNKIPALVASL